MTYDCVVVSWMSCGFEPGSGVFSRRAERKRLVIGLAKRQDIRYPILTVGDLSVSPVVRVRSKESVEERHAT